MKSAAVRSKVTLRARVCARACEVCAKKKKRKASEEKHETVQKEC